MRRVVEEEGYATMRHERRVQVWRDERGVALIEFALILPIFVLIVAGILGFGRVFFYWIEANHQANEAARWAVVDRNPYAPTTLQGHVAGSATTEFQSDVKVCIDFPPDKDLNTVAAGDSVRVRVQKPFAFVPILGIGDITIAGSATMRVERIAGSNPTSYDPADDIGVCA